MVNAWSLAASVLNGTLDEDYPIMDKTKGRWDEDIAISSRESDEYDPIIAKVEKAYDDYYGYKNDDDGLDYEVDMWESDEDVTFSEPSYYDDYMADIDDQRAHHFHHYTNANSAYNDGWTQQYHKEQLEKMDYKPQRNHQYKYHEQEILKDIEEYVSRTYQGHYTGTKHEFRKVQTIDLMAARDIAAQFCQANILKYGSRYGSKDGRNKTDLLKVIHYAMLLLHFDGHYSKPSMTSGNIDHNMP